MEAVPSNMAPLICSSVSENLLLKYSSYAALEIDPTTDMSLYKQVRHIVKEISDQFNAKQKFRTEVSSQVYLIMYPHYHESSHSDSADKLPANYVPGIIVDIIENTSNIGVDPLTGSGDLDYYDSYRDIVGLVDEAVLVQICNYFADRYISEKSEWKVTSITKTLPQYPTLQGF
jgi:hypothetical protein